MPQPAKGVHVRWSDDEPPEAVALASPGPTPAMAAIGGVGVVSAQVNDDGFWTAHIVTVSKGSSAAPMDLIANVEGDDIVVDLWAEGTSENGRRSVVFEGLAAGGATREMVAAQLEKVLSADEMRKWWATPNPSLLNNRPGDIMEEDPDGVFSAALQLAAKGRLAIE